ncbi:hypothetical protein SAMN05216378_3673 [Paenibacillus catalpae]|uniref:Uncharacterized protein n=1 Tax=Paenibacillus catalpae TaxID=1045775 RepID=A0A1I2BUV6_9BACL|nr:hypothetical protein SAMN05216378_3673 [Paenibacillus catalpae]
MILHAEPYSRPRLLAIHQKIAYVEIFICHPVRPYPSKKPAPPPRVIWLHLYSSGWSGWASCPFPSAYSHIDPVQWASVFSKWKGLSVEESLETFSNHDDSHDMIRNKLAKTALLNMFENVDHRIKHKVLMDEAISYCYYRIN